MDARSTEEIARTLVRRFAAESGLGANLTEYAEDQAVALLVAQPLFVFSLALSAIEGQEAGNS